ncbi:LOW QUALITY PROTEIN: cyclic AMP-responsive element-binding protein 3-like protein 2 [Phyllopteryx taeniolatus]|uniref:LOW QUALITY PROTEIN: cyclic AMP-responsive element-binding protein 3-like protein 2 n=1 Tax=Phyllopteryx taeniolatus TaxID=161469 RepID=UPI002AD2C4D5|nr:LOW QUALITY PROTEIN: cyclic AMP-responsive element-binding protein 3-like protein 2 [Phyllopteryx taeniolatus]
MEILDSSEGFLHWDRNLSELSDAGDMDCALYTNHFSELLDDLSHDLSHDALLGQLLSDPFLSGVRGGAGRLDGDDEEGEEGGDLCMSSSPPPHIAAEHSYSLCGDSRPQSPLSHLTGERGSDAESEGDSSEWPMEQDEPMEGLLCDAPSLMPALAPGSASGPQAPEDPVVAAGPAQTPVGGRNQDKSIKVKEEKVFPQIKLEPHEVDQFLNLSPKGLEALQMPPTPPSSHGSDSEGSQSPVRAPLGLSRPTSPSSTAPAQPGLKASTRGSSTATSSSLSNSPLLTAPHKLQGSGPLMLTEEERRTLVAEGYPVPTKLPLTKAEEKALKKIRRKIKNKISAQESRRKKKEYMDTLEKKVETCSNENNDLRRKVDTLECANKSLLQQLQALQALLSGKVSKSCRVAGTQTSSCLMVVVLCFALFLGSFYPAGLTSGSGVADGGLASKQPPVKESYASTVKSRSLLSTFEDEPPHPRGLGGEYPDQWEDAASAVVMAAWRRSGEQQKTWAGVDETGRAETRPPFRNRSNKTSTSDNMRRPLEQRAKSIALERSVNETS